MPSPDYDLSFLGLDAEKVEQVRRLIVAGVADGIDAGAQRVERRLDDKYGIWVKVGIASTAVIAGLALIGFVMALADRNDG